jgi:DNA-directed RNA polymerase specialized sigma24 family protein
MSTSDHELRLQVGGTVNPRTGVYIVRPSDDQLLQLLERSEYANILCSRQMGKSSLLMRTKSRLAKKGYAVAAIDVAGYLGSSSDADEWYQGLLDHIAHQLCLKVDVATWWQSSRAITPNQRLIQFFRDEIAAKSIERVVIFLDEIDSTHRLPYTDDFFVAIRAMYNDRAAEPLYDRITFCLVGVASPNELIKDRRTTPYNIGRTIELQDFDPERDDLSPLIRAISTAPEKGEAVVQSVLRWTGGHPYLTVRLCDQLASAGQALLDDVDGLIEKQFTSLDQLHSDVHFQQVLRFLGERVEDRLAALALYQSICNGKKVRDHTTPAHIALKLSGIVKGDGLGCLAVRNQIYARVFTAAWVAKSFDADVHPFDRLLESLAPDRELAGAEYERLRTALVRYFVVQQCESPEDLADETFDRVANRIEKGEVIQGLAGYCFGVAKRVAMESRIKQKQMENVAPDGLIAEYDYPEDRREQLLKCLDRCLQRLPTEQRLLVMAYYAEERQAKIDKRRELAKNLEIGTNALRIRAARLRSILRDCVNRCIADKVDD